MFHSSVGAIDIRSPPLGIDITNPPTESEILHLLLAAVPINATPLAEKLLVTVLGHPRHLG